MKVTALCVAALAVSSGLGGVKLELGALLASGERLACEAAMKGLVAELHVPGVFHASGTGLSTDLQMALRPCDLVDDAGGSRTGYRLRALAAD